MRNLTFICRVNRMAPIAWIFGLPKIVVYGENELTTMNVTTTSLPSMLMGREIWPWGITTLPSKETNGESYLARSWFFNPSPLNRFGYITSAPLPWFTITLFTKNPLIRAAITNASSYGWIFPSKSSSSKSMGSNRLFILFVGGCS